ncbi:hypothetical protein PR001_g10728 [Phytophthora rubi]|uniref:DDE-1 domain-containing protein n=1 Tax=Phytophthora rubi TaxID=129364 RepID=A0A6A3MRS1_9STRA|nr:hypothetical protein PR002_g10810 [Phytophthora rubi]KAE9032194.1 hypothetical protein PR001_g10728 [Phytophthora rubi]
MRKNWVNYILHELRNCTATIPFKLKAPTRQQIIAWTKTAWNSLTASVITSGFRKANILPTQLAPASESDPMQDLLDTEPDWALFDRLLAEVPVVRHVVDSSRDIDTLIAEN